VNAPDLLVSSFFAKVAMINRLLFLFLCPLNPSYQSIVSMFELLFVESLLFYQVNILFEVAGNIVLGQ
jgi:hypothetical protein